MATSNPNLNVDHDSLQTLEGDLEKMKGTLQTQIRTLESVVEGVSGAWSGAAASEYKLLQAEVNEDVRRMAGVLETIKQLVGDARGHFSSMDDEHRQALAKLRGNAGSNYDSAILDRLG
jgi:WXG100 family type VII secretion target